MTGEADGTRRDWPVTYARKVRFSDSDAQGIVFNGNYLTYFDDTITDYLEAAGLPWETIVERGYEMVLGRVEVDFRSPGRLGDSLVTGARVARIGTTSMTFELATWAEPEGRVVVEGREVHVVLDHVTFRRRRSPTSWWGRSSGCRGRSSGPDPGGTEEERWRTCEHCWRTVRP